MEKIIIKGARANNLDDIYLELPKNNLIVFTGVSGSGKSSLTMDTLFAEGQRRYVESLSSYARQFLMRMKKPEIDYIKGICPAIAIEQKVSTRNARSTVGTLTELYDFLRLLYARIGKTISPISGMVVKKHEVSDVVDFIKNLHQGAKVKILIPISAKYDDLDLTKTADILIQKGFTRVLFNGDLANIEDLMTDSAVTKKELLVLIDRLIIKDFDDAEVQRIGDSINTAFNEADGACFVEVDQQEKVHFNHRFELDGMSFPENTPHLFNFNNPYGACPQCEGFSLVMGIDEKKVIPNPYLSVYEGAISCWKGEKLGQWLDEFLAVAHRFDFPVHLPYNELSKEQKKLLWNGNKHFFGINAFFNELQEKLYKIQNRVLLARYRGRTKCHQCDGSRLRIEASYVKINGKNIGELVEMPLDELSDFFNQLQLTSHEEKIAKRLLYEINSRISFMLQLGLNYLTLNRFSSTLSGGETQRINLTRTLGSHLTDSMYILDEPSVGMHPRDTARLVDVLIALKNKGNTVLVVEHEEDVIKNADYLVDIGPFAGIHGGKVVFSGHYSKINEASDLSLTASYLTGKLTIPVPITRRTFSEHIAILGAKQHNLKNIDVKIPLHCITVISGVSGSGKTTLVKEILYPALMSHLGLSTTKTTGNFDRIEGNLSKIKHVELVNQHPIGKSSRSNPVTYVKAYDSIRQLMADRPLSVIKGFKPKHFSFNVDGGRCDSCKGEGEQIIEMQFLADIKLECEECGGKRFKKDVLDVTYKDKNIAEILDLSIEEAIDFFQDEKDIVIRLKPLDDVGLGYVKLGQSSSTLSGGEAQRVKLASYLGIENNPEHIFFIFDEPTTGLHFHDILKLLSSFNRLIEKGHTVLVVEHNLEIIKNADWLIDLGPEGGANGGHLVYQGIPEGIAQANNSHTGTYLRDKLNIA
jgi:excinuclease ABC subunit A